MKDLLFHLRMLHGKLHEWVSTALPAYKERFCNPGAVYLVLTPEHGNLGDHAIAEAEIEIMHEVGIPYIEVTGNQLNDWRKKKLLNVMNGRPIFINGGGNIGTLWPEVETLMEEIVSSNPRSSILILPNSSFFDNDKAGQLALEKATGVYNFHKHLTIYAREKISYGMMQHVFHNVSLVPDMVLRMNKCKTGVLRSGCILCLRSDRERTRSEKMQKSIEKQVKELFDNNYNSLDMMADHNIPVSNRNEELEKQYDAFRHAELVVTDRLHGMIFCAITGTPCIVIDSKSPKVPGCYEWIRNLQYIRFCNDVTKIAEIYRSIPKAEWTYDNSKILPLYDSLITEIRTAAKRK